MFPPSQVQEEHMPDAEASIGIIHPPPDMRRIIDKTASLVARNGPRVERIISTSNTGNPKFSFLNGSDPYHAYYQHRLMESQFQLLKLAAPVIDPLVRKTLDPMEAEQYKLQLPEGITREELDIIKHTAQSVASNGISFITELTSREKDSPQYQFLKPTHSRFMFFTSLADAYWKVLMVSKGLPEKMEKSVAEITMVLEHELHRLERERSQEQAMSRNADDGIVWNLPGPRHFASMP